MEAGNEWEMPLPSFIMRRSPLRARQLLLLLLLAFRKRSAADDASEFARYAPTYAVTVGKSLFINLLSYVLGPLRHFRDTPTLKGPPPSGASSLVQLMEISDNQKKRMKEINEPSVCARGVLAKTNALFNLSNIWRCYSET